MDNIGPDQQDSALSSSPGYPGHIAESSEHRFIDRERQKVEDVKGYLTASGQASARTRSLIVVLIVASVLTAVGVLNSLQESWMSRRLELMRSSDSPYLVKYIGARPVRSDYDRRWHDAYVRDRALWESYHQMAANTPPAAVVDTCSCCPCGDSNTRGWFITEPNRPWYIDRASEEYRDDNDLWAKRYLAFLTSASNALVDNRFFVHVPFFGTTFDVNDLGILSGVGLVSILLLLWFSEGTELENLRVSFSETQRLRCLAEFYGLAAMRQVLTIPPLPGRKVRWYEVWLAKPVYFVAPAVYLWLFAQDLNTNWIGRQLDTTRLRVLMGAELLCLSAIIALAVQSFLRSRQIDKTWTYWWFRYIAEQFERTAGGEWLRLAWQEFEEGRISARDWSDILPRLSRFPGFPKIYFPGQTNDTHIFESRDGLRLVLNLAAQSIVLETSKRAAS